MKPLPVLLSLSLVTAGCGDVCTSELVPGIRVLLNGTWSNVTVTATEGAFTETVNVTPGASAVDMVHERPGTYRVEVSAPGYVPWTMSSVRVEDDDCHVRTVEVAAELVAGGDS